MQILKETLDALGINAAAAFTGSLGAALAALRMQASTFLSRLVYFGIGVACALWAPPLLVWGFSLPAAPSTYSALGFACGYFGLSLVDAIGEFINALRKADWQSAINSAIKRFFGGGTG